MSKTDRVIVIMGLLLTTSAVMLSLGCDGNGDGTGPGPNPPPVDYLSQTFSLAVADGSASADGFAHNGVAVITLDWNNESPGPNVVAPAYIYEYEEGYPAVDGGLSTDVDTWAVAPESVLALSNIYGDGGVTTVRIKSVYTDVTPPRIWFLLQWDDAGDSRQGDNSGFWGHRWEVVSKQGSGDDWWDTRFDLNEDWVAFMWDTWDRVYIGGGPEVYFEPKTDGFQANGCAVTCHAADTNPHHTNEDGEVCDLWMWTGTRTNYTADQTNWGAGIDDPAFIFDCLVDERGFDWGTGDAFPRDSDGNYVEWLSFDTGASPYIANEYIAGYYPAGYPNYCSPHDPGDNWKYLWLSDLGVQEMGPFGLSPTDERWEIGDRVAGYVHRTAYAGCSEVLGRGCWKDGVWTLEVEREIGVDYDDVCNDEDVFLGVPGE
ncbi:MAG: hypothetical protein JSW52_09450 [Candidatus Coatesbacteria bacterium]|nr:MAG: hypothetical protein JSW52_09450 [Candidatus Coatesbacteria bacterium]